MLMRNNEIISFNVLYIEPALALTASAGLFYVGGDAILTFYISMGEN